MHHIRRSINARSHACRIRICVQVCVSVFVVLDIPTKRLIKTLENGTHNN
jgi:hypothetical protein